MKKDTSKRIINSDKRVFYWYFIRIDHKKDGEKWDHQNKIKDENVLAFSTLVFYILVAV